MAYKDLKGFRFGLLIALKYLGLSFWKCICDCGNECRVNAGNLQTGHTKSCGCHKVATLTKHGKANSPEYDAWANMTGRCENPNHPNFKHYGARGIRVIPTWLGRGGFVNFYAYIGPRPTPKHSIERIDNSKGYEPGNVKWATRDEQMRNTRATHFIEIYGVNKTVTEWGLEKGISPTTIHHRMERGMSSFHAVMTPPREGGRRTPRRA